MAREPKLVENTKQAVFLLGKPASQRCKELFRDLVVMTKPHSKLLDRKKEIRPFEDVEPVEYHAQKMDASLFAIATHNKKRPHNMIIGRTFDHRVLEMVELGVDSLTLMSQMKAKGSPALGSKPCLSFTGDQFETNADLLQLKSILIDFFRGPVVDNIALNGIDHIIQFTAVDTKSGCKVLMRHYNIVLKKSGTRVPLVELVEVGPQVDWVVRRTKKAAPDVMKEAMKTPKELKATKKKNKETNVLGDTLARVYMQKQNINNLQTRKVRALKKPAPEPKSEEGGDERRSKRVKTGAAE